MKICQLLIGLMKIIEAEYNSKTALLLSAFDFSFLKSFYLMSLQNRKKKPFK